MRRQTVSICPQNRRWAARRRDWQEAAEKLAGVRLVVEDDGVGFSPEGKGVEHLGLVIMRERAADVGAELAVESRIGEGTRVILDWYGSVEDVKYKS